MIEQVQVTYSLLGKAFKKQTKTIEYQRKKWRKTLVSLNFSNAINELKQVKDIFSDNWLIELVKNRLK